MEERGKVIKVEIPDNAGQPVLYWPGKQPLHTVNYNEARLKEIYGEPGREGWVNRLYRGDNIEVMSHLMKEFRGKINLIYIDPPFESGTHYQKSIKLKKIETKSSSFVIEEKQYNDIWAGDSYLQFMYERLQLMRELLAEDGSIYVHLDEHRSHYIKVILDEIFGRERFQREIVWRIGWISGYKSAAKNWIRNHDVILFYTKSSSFTFNKEYIPYPENYRRRDGSFPRGPGYPLEDTWNCSDLDELNSIQIMSFSREKCGYPTQKNEKLLERIIKASSNPGDLVADFFCGSGTTLVAAQRLGRRWIGADDNPAAVYITARRLLQFNKAQQGLRQPLSGDSEKTASSFAVFSVNQSKIRNDTQKDDKTEPEVEISVKKKGKKVILEIRHYYSPDISLKLQQAECTEVITDWRQVVEAVFIDPVYDGEIFRPSVLDITTGNSTVAGVYELPATRTGKKIAVKIVDVLAGECFMLIDYYRICLKK